MSRVGRAFIAVGLPVALALLAGEAAVRVRSEYLTPEILQARSLSYEPAVFARHVLTPEIRELTGPRPGQTYRINRRGYRGPDFEWEKPPGVTRVIVYGGSTVFDIDGREGEDWPHLVERELRRRGFPAVEVINAGIPGHASFESVGRFFAEGHLLRPDFVVLYDQWNDLKEFRKTESLLRTLEPYQKDEDLRFAYRNGLDRTLCRTSQLYVRLRARALNRTISAGDEGRKTRELEDTFGAQGPDQYRISVATFVDAARNGRSVPILVREARLAAAGLGEAERALVPLHYHGLTYDALLRAYAVTDSILEEVARSKGVPLVDASTGVSGEQRHFSDYVHLSRDGAAIVAARVADAIAEMLRFGTVSGPAPR
jgi:hypothetical protein